MMRYKTSKTDRQPVFFVDRMLGKLAKWLRIIGYDCDYHPTNDHVEIIQLSRGAGRILLTRDTMLVRRREVGEFLFITSDHLPQQLEQVVTRYGLPPPEQRYSRCIVCNTRLEPASESEVALNVSVYVRSHCSEFYTCRACRRVYW